ncbi:MAG TPA: methyltransferase domain-containing protein [Candidatus Aquicultor sp.]|jgi:ubiquinone/menaquinone biosynthesis C-methylase UbiE
MKLTSSFWQNYFKAYDVLNMVYPYQVHLDTIAEYCGLQKDGRVLDAGCGTGNLSCKLGRHCSNVIGIDNVEAALVICRNKVPDADFILHDLNEPLPFTDNYVDAIVCNFIIHILSPGRRPFLIQEFYRILKPGGKIVISNPGKDFSSLAVYKAHLRHERERFGRIITLVRAARLVLPTLRMFYYSSKIQDNAKGGDLSFFIPGEQRQLLERAGFNTSPEQLSYAGQGLLIVGRK